MISEAAFSAFAARVVKIAGLPRTFLLMIAVVLLWAATGPLFHWSDTWQLVINTGTTIVTFLMVFVLQHSQNRDGAAIQLKLDELIRASQASNRLIAAEEWTPERLEAEAHRLRARAAREP